MVLCNQPSGGVRSGIGREIGEQFQLFVFHISGIYLFNSFRGRKYCSSDRNGDGIPVVMVRGIAVSLGESPKKISLFNFLTVPLRVYIYSVGFNIVYKCFFTIHIHHCSLNSYNECFITQYDLVTSAINHVCNSLKYIHQEFFNLLHMVINT